MSSTHILSRFSSVPPLSAVCKNAPFEFSWAIIGNFEKGSRILHNPSLLNYHVFGSIVFHKESMQLWQVLKVFYNRPP